MSSVGPQPAGTAAGDAASVTFHVVGRALTALAAVLAAVTVWLGFRAVGVVPEVPTGLEQQLRPLGAGPVIAASLSAGLAAWVFSMLLEYRAARPRLWWTATALGAFLVSLLPIPSVEGNAERTALLSMHTAVALVLLVGINCTLPAGRR